MRRYLYVRMSLHSLFQKAYDPRGGCIRCGISRLLTLEAFTMDCGVPFDRFKYVATCGRVPEDHLFLYTLPYRILANYLTSLDEELRYHPKCLSNSPLPIHRSDCLRMIVYNKTWHITQLLHEKKLYWCAICDTLLFDIKTGRYAGCARLYKF